MRNDKQRPNVVVVYVDDMGYGDLSCFGGPRGCTPHIDRLAAEGIRFTQFYVNSPICSPSRTALTTGQYPARWRITSFLETRQSNAARGMAQWLDPKAPTVARALQQRAGYATGHFGKWHMGGQRDVGEAPLITEYGFDASLTQFEGLGDRVLAMLDDRDGKPPRKMPLGEGSEKLGRGKITWRDRAEVTDAFVDAATAFMEKAEKAGKPFYVNVWPDDVHSPFFPPAGMRGDGSKRALYDGVLRHMDAQLGRLFDFVRTDPKRRDNTLVLFASDNGPEPGAGSAGPFRGAKANLYEGGIRTPLIAWGPGLLPSSHAGSTNDRAVLSAVDIAASLPRLAGIEPERAADLDGEDLSATLLGRSEAGRRAPLFWSRPPDRPGPPRNPWPDLAIRDGDWKLLLWDTPKERVTLHNLRADPRERSDLASAHPDVVRRLRTALLDWRKTLPKM